MVKNMPISEARDKLTSLHGELKGTGNTIAVTNRGNPVLAVLNWELYESILETLEIMSDPDLVKTSPHRSPIHLVKYEDLDNPKKWANTWRAYLRKKINS